MSIPTPTDDSRAWLHVTRSLHLNVDGTTPGNLARPLAVPLYPGAFDKQTLPRKVRELAPWIRYATFALVLVTWAMASTLVTSHMALAAFSCI